MSLIHIIYSEKEATLQITSRIFIDDLEDALKARYGIQTYLATSKEKEKAQDYLEAYLNTKFTIALNGIPVSYTFLGKRYDNDQVLCYMEISDINLPEINSLTVQNSLLTDVFNDQKNVVHVQWGSKKKSFVLQKEDYRKTLKL